MPEPAQARFLSLWFPRLPADRILRKSHGISAQGPIRSGAPADAPPPVVPPRGGARHPRRQGWRGEAGALSAPPRAAPAGRLFAVVGRTGNATLVQSLNEAAEKAGLRPGMPLAEAKAMFPALETATGDGAADAALLADVAAWCQRWTPLVGLDGPDRLMLDMTGCLHLYGGAGPCLDQVVNTLNRQGFSCRAGLAATPGAARALSHFGAGALCPPGEEMRRIGPLPVAALFCAEAVTEGLRQAGLRRIDDLAARPRAPLAARFGAALLSRLDEALGQASSPVSPAFPTPAYLVERRFQDPIGRIEDIEASIRRLAERLAGMLESHGEGLRRAEVVLFRTDGAVRRLAVGAGRPLRDGAALLRLFRERLAALGDEIDPGFGFDLVRLAALAVEPMAQTQQVFGKDDAAGEAVAALVDRLGARLGARRVAAAQALDVRLPEDGLGLVPLAAGPRRSGWPAGPPTREPANRPLRLLARPEPVEAIASVPDGPPLRFRWRRRLIAAAKTEGPERIAPEWWRKPAGTLPLTRDYFRVEDQAGHRFWLFRDGLFGAETVQPRWFVHGIFA